MRFNTVCDAGITCTLTRNVLSDGSYEMDYDMAATAAGNCRSALPLDLAAMPAGGAEIWVRAQATVMSGCVNFRGCNLEVDSNYGASRIWTDGWCDNTLVLGGSVSQGLQPGDIQETFDFLLKVKTEAGAAVSFTPRFYHYFAGTGSARVKWRYYGVEAKLY